MNHYNSIQRPRQCNFNHKQRTTKYFWIVSYHIVIMSSQPYREWDKKKGPS